MRREVRQLTSGDQIRLQINLQFEVADIASTNDEFVTLSVRPVPCGPDCGRTCDCHSSMFGEAAGPYSLQLKGVQRLEFLGNLRQLLADSERLQAQIARLKIASGKEPNSAKSQPAVSTAKPGHA